MDTTLKFRFVCEDKTYSEFSIIKTIYELLDKGLNDSRITSVKRVDRFSGKQDSVGVDVFENDVIQSNNSYYKIQLNGGNLLGISKDGDEYGPYRFDIYTSINKEKFKVINQVS
jgi:hypothetical protein